MPVRLGELLIQLGVLTADQRDEILDRQRQRARPFGVLAEELFGVDPRVVERAWSVQFSAKAERIDPRGTRIPGDILELIERRQAWQFGLLPVGWDGEDLVIATSEAHLPRAMRFAGWRIPVSCAFKLCDDVALHEALSEHYPMASIDRDFLRSAGIG